MSDKNSDIGTDFEEKLAKIANEKSRKRINNNIYERFISRVESAEEGSTSNNRLKPFVSEDRHDAIDSEASIIISEDTTFDFLHKLASEETSAAEDEWLDSDSGDASDTQPDGSHMDDTLDVPEEAIDVTLPDEITADSGSDEQTAQDLPDQDISNQNSVTQELATAQNKQSAQKKPIVIGMVVGSLLITAIVLTLIFTGVLSTSAETPVADDTDATADADENINANTNDGIETEVATEISADETTSDERPLPDVAESDVARDTQTPTQQPESTDENSSEADKSTGADETSSISAADAEAAITYEDFRQESKNTLYRETND